MHGCAELVLIRTQAAQHTAYLTIQAHWVLAGSDNRIVVWQPARARSAVLQLVCAKLQHMHCRAGAPCTTTRWLPVAPKDVRDMATDTLIASELLPSGCSTITVDAR